MNPRRSQNTSRKPSLCDTTPFDILCSRQALFFSLLASTSSLLLLCHLIFRQLPTHLNASLSSYNPDTLCLKSDIQIIFPSEPCQQASAFFLPTKFAWYDGSSVNFAGLVYTLSQRSDKFSQQEVRKSHSFQRFLFPLQMTRF